MRYVPSKPGAVPVVWLRIDDLLILAATVTGFVVTSLGCCKRELLPFVSELKHQFPYPATATGKSKKVCCNDGAGL